MENRGFSLSLRLEKNERTMKKAALFDMDGTLVDNTAAHIRAFGLLRTLRRDGLERASEPGFSAWATTTSCG